MIATSNLLAIALNVSVYAEANWTASVLNTALISFVDSGDSNHAQESCAPNAVGTTWFTVINGPPEQSRTVLPLNRAATELKVSKPKSARAGQTVDMYPPGSS